MIIKRELYFEHVEAEEFYRVISAIDDFFWDMKNEDNLKHFPGNNNVLTDITIDKLIKNLACIAIKFKDFINYIKEEEIGKVAFKEIEANSFGFVDIQSALIYKNSELHTNGEVVNIFSRVSDIDWNFFCDDEEVEKIFFKEH